MWSFTPRESIDLQQAWRFLPGLFWARTGMAIASAARGSWIMLWPAPLAASLL